jgi:formylglycine-generating enzyme required for sulfatase activity
LLNRTFTGGGAVGKVVKHLEAETGELLEGAKVVDVAGAKTVQNEQQPGSGVELPLRGLRTATYNVRVRYSNPSGTEARLTMMADGPPRAENDYPHYIPLFLPPTAQGEFKTISFLWSLYDRTTWLKIQWMENDAHGRNVGHPLQNDLGQPMIDWIDLVKVEPTEMPEARDSVFPEMVPIPGGKFTMGDNEGRPDERPAHQVSVSPLAMSKFEITNEQYERFDPEHRAHRDGYSWRDREPVIYVSWLDGVKYCNWLSSQAGLQPAYREEEREIKQGDRVEKRKVWTVDLSAEGFRLPTEAEWEYVAQGRGENRRFPWGDEPPTPGVHAHWSGAKSLAPDPRLPSQYTAGAMVVGSFPKGASRDGVMDLVGNVSESCSDWLEPYTDKSVREPVGRTPGNYRSIRGSSRGYYGHPAEVVDREYNNPNYPGYVYIGLRVVLPEPGWRKVQRRR